MKKKPGFETIALHAGHKPDSASLSRAVPIYQTTSYVFKNTAHAARLFSLKEKGNTYTRIANPTCEVLEGRVAALEGGAGALATASGMAAETVAVLNVAGRGDHIVSSSSLYGGTYTLFRYTFARMGIDVTFVDSQDPEAFRRAIRPNTKLLYAEVLGNPRVDVLDISAVAKVAHGAGLPLFVDNTVPTPYLCRPMEWGADVVVHSLTKWLGGHGNSIGGIIVDSGRFDWHRQGGGRFPTLAEPDPSYHGLNFSREFGKQAFITRARVQVLRDLGPALSPFNAFLILQGIETLALRMKRHSENALTVARFLERHRAVSWVSYPGLKSHPGYKKGRKYLPRGAGSLLGFGIRGGRRAGARFIDSVRLLSHLANIGDAKSLVIHPASTTHQQLSAAEQARGGVTDDFVRLSVGIEDVKDIIADISSALTASQAGKKNRIRGRQRIN